MTRDDLTAWIEDLRGRLERGELADVGPLLIEPFHGGADVERLHTGRLLRELPQQLNG
jgi:hypothetical protein